MQMHAIDGCNSQKHDKTVGACDERIFSSQYFLPCDFVDGFKDEVKLHPAAVRATRAMQDAEVLEDGSTVSRDKDDKCCGSNWKAVNLKELPLVSKEVFDQTGMFACLCQHGIVEFLIEFVQSAEM
jgi:hypothetical protein